MYTKNQILRSNFRRLKRQQPKLGKHKARSPLRSNTKIKQELRSPAKETTYNDNNETRMANKEADHTHYYVESDHLAEDSAEDSEDIDDYDIDSSEYMPSSHSNDSQDEASILSGDDISNGNTNEIYDFDNNNDDEVDFDESNDADIAFNNGDCDWGESEPGRVLVISQQTFLDAVSRMGLKDYMLIIFTTKDEKRYGRDKVMADAEKRCTTALNRFWLFFLHSSQKFAQQVYILYISPR
jgi:hypothetical protein